MTAGRKKHKQHGRGRRGLLARMLWACSSVRLGLLLFVVVANYAALGTVSLGPLFEALGGRAEAPEPTLRHLPWIDLTESEYYSTTLFGGLLIAIVVNMSLATLLRIRWEWRKSGVIITHAGVVVLAAGAFIATRSPLNATMALFADEPTNSGLDRSRTLLATRPDRVVKASVGQWRIDDILPRYADFGVPWADGAREIELDQDVRITGYAHSARLVPRIEAGDAQSPPGWQLTEKLRSGETRIIALVADDSERSSTTLSNGTRVTVSDRAWFRSDEHTLNTIRESEAGAVLIHPDTGSEVMLLPAVPGAVSTLRTTEGEWSAEFLDRTGTDGQMIANLRLTGPGFASALVYSAAWDPSVSGLYTEAAEGGIALIDLPAGMRVLFLDRRQDAILLSPDAWVRNHRGGSMGLEPDPLNQADEIRIDATTSLAVDRRLEHAEFAEKIQRIPLVQDAQLLADPRLGSLIRVTDAQTGDGLGTWIGFDEQGGPASESRGFVYAAAPFSIDDATIAFRGFEAELFRRGSVPRDFSVQLEIVKGSGARTHTLSLNRPVRASLEIDGRSRRVQLSLIGWDSEGWEARRAGTDDRFEGTRFVIVTVTQREGVGLSIVGGGMVLFGASLSVLGRMARRRTRAEDTA